MRTKDKLYNIEDMCVLLQYLYLSEDHYIIYTNTLGVSFKVMMDDNYKCKKIGIDTAVPNMEFSFNDLTPEVLSDLVGHLKTRKSMFPKRFDNKWEEIKEITLASIALNKMH